uniref:Uncharacterized protein n=1 Tax=Aegilops tauschii subsp. strangulata TaxID=200361 RepID=A0A453EF14_AEGTS
MEATTLRKNGAGRSQNHLHSPRTGISVHGSKRKPNHFQMPIYIKKQVHMLAKPEDDIRKKGDHQIATRDES